LRLRYSFRSASIFDPISSGPFGFDSSFSELEEFRERTFAVGALGRVEDAIHAVRTQPGRKAVVLVSDGFVLFGPGFANVEVREAMRRLVDRANRAGVVIYAVDARGLVCGCLTAADKTGGFAVVNTNGIPGALERIAGDLRGYYLIGFQPDADTFSSDGRFRRIRITVKRPGVKVRTRAGFYGVPTP
jgi:hypothetical protein